MRLPILCVLLVFFSMASCVAGPAVRTGADLLLARNLSLVQGKKVGLITNQTGRLADGERLVDALVRMHVDVVALFGPEHGSGGSAAPGAIVADSIDAERGIPVYSLYGKTRRPTPAMLAGVDLLIYDIQDVGVRYYTFISTMVECMNAAAAAGKEFIVLDRPDLQGGIVIDGPVLPDSLRSFVGPLPIPVVYGLTVGELATLVNDRGWLEQGRRVALKVVWMEGWKRGMMWRETGLPWISPSPNIRSPETALAYPVTCYLEATSISEGRGTGEPFLICGAPFVDGGALSALMQANSLPGVSTEPALFMPEDSKQKGRRCSGVRLILSDKGVDRPVVAGVALLRALMMLARDSINVKPSALNRLLGDPACLAMLTAGASADEIAVGWNQGLEEYLMLRQKYLHYPSK